MAGAMSGGGYAIAPFERAEPTPNGQQMLDDLRLALSEETNEGVFLRASLRAHELRRLGKPAAKVEIDLDDWSRAAQIDHANYLNTGELPREVIELHDSLQLKAAE